MTIAWYWYCTSPVIALWDTIICMDPRDLRSSWVPRVYWAVRLHPLVGRLDSSTHDPVNPGGASGSLLLTRVNSPGQAAPSGSQASCMLGEGRTAGSSSRGPDFCSGDEALSVGMEGVTGSFSTLSNSEMSNDCPSGAKGLGIFGAPEMLCTASLGAFWIVWHMIEEPGPAPPFHPTASLGWPGSPGAVEGGNLISAHPDRMEWSNSHTFLLGPWASWRLQPACWLGIGLECNWGVRQPSGKYPRIPTTSWVSFHSSWCRTGSSHWWCLGWGVGRLSGSVPHWDFFVFWEGAWQGFEGTGVLRASICSVEGAKVLGASIHSVGSFG